jgi:hypothetical protein
MGHRSPRAFAITGPASPTRLSRRLRVDDNFLSFGVRSQTPTFAPLRMLLAIIFLACWTIVWALCLRDSRRTDALHVRCRYGVRTKSNAYPKHASSSVAVS